MAVKIKKNGSIWTVVLSRCQSKNAIDPETASELYKAFIAFESDKIARVAVLWGEGGVFCSGWDLKYAATLSGTKALDQYDFSHEDVCQMGVLGPTRLDLSKPVIAAVSGAAVAGGMELALWADIRVMEDTAFMGVYCRRWGIPLIDGGTVRLPRLIGEGRAMDLILTGRKVKAKEAMDIGLCEYLVRDGQALIKAEKLAEDIARFPQSCMRADRRSVRSQHHLKRWEAMNEEWKGSKSEVSKGIKGALAFVSGKGRGGDFSNL